MSQPSPPSGFRYQPEPIVARLVHVDNDFKAIKIQDCYAKLRCRKYWESKWCPFTQALPSPSERAIIQHIRCESNLKMFGRSNVSQRLIRAAAFIQHTWPMVDLDQFAIKLTKLVHCEEGDSDEDSDSLELYGPRFCQAILGVASDDDDDEEDNEETHNAILIGPKVLRNLRDGKKPEFDLERRAMIRMVKTASMAMQLLTPMHRKRLAEETYEGSTSPPKKSRMDDDENSPIDLS